jgi:acetyl-CoA carboxylase carboxyl transferase subunit alpha
MRFFNMAEKYKLPILIFIDTPGAYPGIGAEERGQAEAIARNIRDMFRLKVPIIIVIIGEGASGGALGIGIGDKIMMLEYSWYSVISPEGCAAILWRDAAFAPDAAEALKVTSGDLIKMKIIDKIIDEPPSGAHNNHKQAAKYVKKEIVDSLDKFTKMPTEELLNERMKKYRWIGEFTE